MSRKLAFKWLGLYCITVAVTNKKTYLFEQLDGIPLAYTFAGGQLKKFYPRQEFRLDHQPEIDHKIVPNLEDLLGSKFNDPLSELDNFSNS